MKRFEGKVAVVTGGASGIGNAVAKALLREGAKVAILDLDEKATAAAAKSMDAPAGHVLGIITDVGREESVNLSFARIEETFGRLDVVINAAGILSRGSLEETDSALWQRIIDVDLTSVYLTSRAALPAMKRSGGGAIVNIASVAGIRGVVNVAYVAAKGGVVALTMQLGGELAKFNIRVNAVSPGYTVTPLNTDMRSKGLDRYWTGRVPMGRYAQPEEMAAACLFLASSEASYVTGTNLVVDGGMSCVLLPDREPVPAGEGVAT